MPTTGMVTDLRRIYHDLNADPTDWRVLREAKGGAPVEQRFWTSPESRGYPAKDVNNELWAEAIRAYMSDPNYLKTTSPKVAARIRKYVNPNPEINPYIQFNSLAAPVLPFGMLLHSMLDEERQP